LLNKPEGTGSLILIDAQYGWFRNCRQPA